MRQAILNEKLNICPSGTYKIRMVLGSLFSAIVADGIITRFALDNGFGEEGNPFLQYWVFDNSFLTIKIFGGLLAIFYLWRIYKRNPKFGLAFSSVLLTVYTLLLFWNLLAVFP